MGIGAMFAGPAGPRWGVRLQRRQLVSAEESCFFSQLLLRSAAL